MKCKLLEVSHNEFQKKSVEVFMGYMENSIYGLIQMRLYYESILLKIQITWQPLVEVFYIKFQQNLWNSLRDLWESPFMVLHKLSCITCQYAFKSELPDKFRCKPPISKFTEICETVNGICGKVLLWLYIYNKSSYAVLRITGFLDFFCHTVF
jgi:hypothetical protein